MKLIFSEEQVQALELAEGLRILASEYHFTPAYEGEDGIPVELKDFPGDVTETRMEQGKAELCFDFSRRFLFFRGLSVLLQALSEGKEAFCVTESACFDTLGPMLDVSQGNMVLHTDALKILLRRSAMMGLSMCMLYMEDNFEVPEYPYFGYMRGRYSFEELKELDDYAYALGIEMIPAIQTLAHQTTVVVWDDFLPMRENHMSLLPGEPKTYEFLRCVLAAATAPFRSRRVHIGMDECDHLGHGAHFLHHGLVDKGEIMLEHLNRVCEICEELDIRPMVWDDQFHQAVAEKSDKGTPNLSYQEKLPQNLDLVIYGYSSKPVEYFEKRIRNHRTAESGGIYCNTVWTWLGFGPNWERTRGNQNAVTGCRNTKVREMILSIWQVGFDCDFRVNYFGMQMFAEMCYKVAPSEEDLRRRFRFCCDGNYDDFMLLHEFDCIPSVPEHNGITHPSCATEFLLWQDPLCGMFDYDLRDLAVNDHFAKLEVQMEQCIRNAEGTCFEPVFRMYRDLAAVLALKSELGIRICKAYREHDRKTLESLAGEILPELENRVSRLRRQRRKCWFQCGKPQGWEVYDLRYGGVLARLDSAAERIQTYLDGHLEKLEELDNQRLSYKRGGMGYAGQIPSWTSKWGRLVSASRVAPEYWLALPKQPSQPEGVD